MAQSIPLTPPAHTPGPWIADRPGTTGTGYYDVTASLGAQAGIVRVAKCNSAHDARLIASAPDLLAALEGLAVNFGSFGGRGDYTLTITGEQMDAARAAIRAARQGVQS